MNENSMPNQNRQSTVNLFSLYSEWIFRIVLLVAVGANIWLTQSFVTRKEFEQQTRDNVSAHLVIQTAVADTAATLKMMAANLAKLEDHESRLRVVELRQTDVIARLNMLERMANQKQ